ncbi:MAG: hypothetical protein IIB37_13440 [Gemmatimonadetes bacterium]|nr:hypothetical protein [Gemmatimonadota bacterium]
MKKVLAVFFVMGVLVCGGIEETGRSPLDDLEDAVAGFLDSYFLAIETRDAALLQDMYVADGRFEWIEDGEIRYRSLDDVLAALASLPANAAIRTAYDGREITPVGTAGARVSTRFWTVIGEGPSAFEFGGMMTMVLEDGPTGWQIVGGHTSSARQDGR